MRKVAVVGGTFEELHAGHLKLLHEAFKLGDKVLIGLTSDKFALETRGRRVLPYKVRKEKLIQLIEASGWRKQYEIIEINDEFGPTVKEKDLHIIVVSTETYYNALKINRYRIRRGLPPMIICVIDLVETETGGKLSSTDINRGIVDAWGRTQSS
jgi:pantetheine-phosphate adenylyltransferase